MNTKVQGSVILLAIFLSTYSTATLASGEFWTPWLKVHFENDSGQQATIVASEKAEHLLSVTFRDRGGHQFSISKACLADIYSPELKTAELLNSGGIVQVTLDKWIHSSYLVLSMKFGMFKPGADIGEDEKDMPIVRFVTHDGVLVERDVIQEKDNQYGSWQILDLTKQTSPDKCGIEAKPESK